MSITINVKKVKSKLSALYSAPELRKAHERCQAVENRCVFSARMKAFCDSSGACSAGGRFH